MNEKFNLKDNNDFSDMLTTNSMFVSTSPKERMLDLENPQIKQNESEYQDEEEDEEKNKKTKDTSLNNLILPAPKIITFNKNEPKHELMFIPVNKIDKLKENEESDDEIKDIELNAENKVDISNKNKLRKKDGSFFKGGIESKFSKKNKKKNYKKEDEEENNDESDYSESRPMLKENSKKDEDKYNDKLNKKKKSKRFSRKKNNDSSDEEEKESTNKSNKNENKKKNNKDYNSEKETEEDDKPQADDDTTTNNNNNNNNKKFNFLDALPAENISTYE